MIDDVLQVMCICVIGKQFVFVEYDVVDCMIVEYVYEYCIDVFGQFVWCVDYLCVVFYECFGFFV